MSNGDCCTSESSCCCSGSGDDDVSKLTPYDATQKWVIGELSTVNGLVPVVASHLNFSDTLGGWKVRWNIGRMTYKVNPGLYAVGTPDDKSPVLVSANYKLTFDALRKELSTLSCWLLILDTKGVNVWCAAGKGTFGTEELIKRMLDTGIGNIVSHRKLISPQLGATGVSAHEVSKLTGFSIVYGPVRACDIKVFLDANCQATEEMRRVEFTMLDRAILTPVELVKAINKSLTLFGVLFILNFIIKRPFGSADMLVYLGAVIIGTVLTPVLLPYIPGRMFALKGWLLGLCWVGGFLWLNGGYHSSILLSLGYLLILPSVAAYFAMNFTGSSTYTSFTGVAKEMRTSLPPIIITSILGVILIVLTAVFGF